VERWVLWNLDFRKTIELKYLNIGFGYRSFGGDETAKNIARNRLNFLWKFTRGRRIVPFFFTFLFSSVLIG